MKTLQKKSHRKLLVAAIVSVLMILVLGSVAYGFFYHSHPVTPPSSSNTTNAATSAEQQNTSTTSNTADNASKTPVNTSPSSTSDSNPTVFSITSPTSNSTIQKSQTPTLAIRTLIQEVGTGTCDLSMTSDGQQPVIQHVSIQSSAQTSTCAGFNVDMSALAAGAWNITINTTINGHSYSASRGVTIQ